MSFNKVGNIPNEHILGVVNTTGENGLLILNTIIKRGDAQDLDKRTSTLYKLLRGESQWTILRICSM